MNLYRFYNGAGSSWYVVAESLGEAEIILKKSYVPSPRMVNVPSPLFTEVTITSFYRLPKADRETRERIIDRAVKMAQNESHQLAIGSAAMHPSETVVAELLRYEGECAILRWSDGRCRSFPAREVVDPNRVLALAMEIRMQAGEG